MALSIEPINILEPITDIIDGNWNSYRIKKSGQKYKAGIEWQKYPMIIIEIDLNNSQEKLKFNKIKEIVILKFRVGSPHVFNNNACAYYPISNCYILDELLNTIMEYINKPVVLQCRGCYKSFERLKDSIKHKRGCRDLWRLKIPEMALIKEMQKYCENNKNRELYLLDTEKEIVFSFIAGKMDAFVFVNYTIEGNIDAVIGYSNNEKLLQIGNYILVGNTRRKSIVKKFADLINKILQQ